MLLFGFGLVFLAFTAAFGCTLDERQRLANQTLNPCPLSGQLTIDYGISLGCGAVVHPSVTAEEPSVRFANVNLDRTYTLLMITTDDSGSNINRLTVYLHWALTKLSPFEIDTGNLPQSEIVYIAPFPNNPPQFSYTFILFEEPENSEISIDPGVSRYGFNLGNFMSANNLCSAVAMSGINVSAAI